MKKIIFLFALLLGVPCLAQTNNENKQILAEAVKNGLKPDENGVYTIDLQPRENSYSYTSRTLRVYPDGRQTITEGNVVYKQPSDETFEETSDSEYRRMMDEAIAKGLKPNSRGLYVLEPEVEEEGEYVVKKTIFYYEGIVSVQTLKWNI